MEKIGIICEYNPFHNGHIYHINKIKEKYPDSIIILVLNGYFLQRGEISILNKYDKTNIALNNGVDIVIELPFIYGTQSADNFAYAAVNLLNKLQVNKIICGSESNDINVLYDIALYQQSQSFQKKIKDLMNTGLNYPTALAKACEISFDYNSNDLLAISYIKASLDINKKIKIETIQRTNEYKDIDSNEDIISASNIRNKIQNKKDIKKYLPKESIDNINEIDYQKLFDILKTIILTNDNLSDYLDVDEGIENRLVKGIKETNNYFDFLEFIKTKRYTYNKINRMLIHILTGLKKEDAKVNIDYIKILGFNKIGKTYITKIKKNINNTINKNSKLYEYEVKASLIYDLLTNDNSYQFEVSTKPIIKK